MEDLPDNILLEIMTYLSYKQFLSLERVSRSFHSLFKSCPYVLYNFLRMTLKSPFFPNDIRPLYRGTKNLYSKLNNSKVIMLEMLAYYTNGGLLRANPFDSMISIFSSDFFSNCYSSKKTENVLIKSIFCGSNLKYSVLKGNWEKKGLAQISDTSAHVVNLSKLRETLQSILTNVCKDAIIYEFCIERPTQTYRSPFKSCVIFSSSEY